MPAPVSDQEVVERRGPSPSLLELELRNQMLEIDKRIAMLHVEEYRRLLLFACLGGGHPPAAAEPLGLPELGRYPALLPAPAAGGSSQAVVAQAAAWPIGPPEAEAVAAAATGPRQSDVVPVPVAPGPGATPTSCRPALPSTLTPLSSQLDSGGVSRRGRGHGRGRGRGYTGYANVAASPTQPRLLTSSTKTDDVLGLQSNALDRDYANGPRATAPTSTLVSRGYGDGRLPVGGSRYPAFAPTTATSSPGSLRRRFRFSLASAYPAGSPTRHDPLSVSAHALPPAGSIRFCSRAAAELFIRENGVETSLLTPRDAALADATPDVLHRRFTELFGGSAEHERPASRERNIVCINPVAQPYGPSSPGESGLLFSAPGIVRFEDNYASFHVFVNMSPPMTHTRDRRYRYLGAYTKVPIIRTTVEVAEWLSLPNRCRAAWSWRLFSLTSPDVRAMHARISIRKTRPQGPPPSPDEIDAWLETYPGRREGITEATLFDAFNVGDEKLDFAVIKCVGYDANVAGKLQGQMVQN